MEIREMMRNAHKEAKMLEIGCGTSQEASRIMGLTGGSVTCLDVAQGMIDFSLEKMRRLGLSGRYRAFKMPAAEVGKIGETFDLVYSFNGALNSEPDLENFFRGIVQVTEPGGVLLLSFRSRFCLGEWLYYRIRNDPDSYRSKRGEYVDVGVVNSSVRVRYLSLKEIRDLLPANFRITRAIGLGILFPPYAASRVKWSLARKAVIAVERILSLVPVISGFGDQILVTAVRVS